MSEYDAAVHAWAAALRGGSTTRWSEFWPSAPATGVAGPAAPGAAQLELVRVLAGRWQGPGFEALADRVLLREGPGRGMAHSLPLLHPSAPAASGAPPIDPSDVPLDELIRVGTGVLADLAIAQPPRRTPKQRRSRRLTAVLGAPISGRGLADEPGLSAKDVVICAPTLDEVLTEVWSSRTQHGRAMPWRRWVGMWAARDVLPLAANPGRLAARAAERVGPQHVHVYVGAAARRAPVPGSPAALTVESVDVLRRVNPVLAVRVAEGERDAVRASAVRLLGGGDPTPLGIPLDQLPWARRRAERMAESIRSGGYAVHGDLGELVAGARAPRHLRASAVLDRLADVVVRTVREEQG